jgi:hypothetical protein
MVIPTCLRLSSSLSDESDQLQRQNGVRAVDKSSNLSRALQILGM